MARYRLRAGKHAQDEQTGQKDKDGKPIIAVRVYDAGQTLDNPADDLHKRWPEKFERTDEPRGRKGSASGTQDRSRMFTPEPAVMGAQPIDEQRTHPTEAEIRGHESALQDGGQGEKAEDQPDLHGMTVQELRELAAEEEIPLHSAKTKDEIIQTIQEHHRG